MSEELKEAQPPAPEVGVIVCKSEDISWADCAKPCPEEPPAGFCARMAELEAERDEFKAKLDKAVETLESMAFRFFGNMLCTEKAGDWQAKNLVDLGLYSYTADGQAIERVGGK